MTRAELLTQLAYELNKTSGPLDALTQNRLLGYMNRRHRRLLSGPGLQHLRHTTLTFDSVADQVLYGLPYVANVQRIVDPSNDRILRPLTMAQYRALQPDAAAQTGTPNWWVWDGYGQTAAQPSAAAELFVKSSSASDVTQTCYVEGTLTGGYPRSASVTLTGVTAVSLGATITTWENVSKVYLSAVPAGVVTLHTVSGAGDELARIGIGQTWQRYYQLRLWQTPSSAITYTADVIREITDFAQDTDEPLLPEDFHDLLFLGTVMDEYRHLDDSRYVAARQEYDRRAGEFAYWMHETASGMTPLDQNGTLRASRLGPWFPAGS